MESLAIKLYPGIKDSFMFGPSDYQPIINHIGKVLVQEDDEDYQGDTFVLLEKDSKYGFLNIGWGSCSGCDALQGCETLTELESLIESIIDEVKWFDTLDSCLEYIASEKRGYDYFGETSSYSKFQQKCLEVKK